MLRSHNKWIELLERSSTLRQLMRSKCLFFHLEKGRKCEALQCLTELSKLKWFLIPCSMLITKIPEGNPFPVRR